METRVPQKEGQTSRERWAEFYARHHKEGRREGFTFGGEDRVKLISDWVGTGGRVLDLGCRDGTLTASYRQGNTVTGVDVDQGAMARAQARLGIETVWHDLNEPLPFDDGSYDVVVAAEVLEHVPMVAALLSEIVRVLRSGGRFVGSVPNAFRLKNRLLFLAGRQYEVDPTHVRQFSPGSLQSTLASVGLGSAEMGYTSSRFLWLSPRLFANDIVFRASRS